MIYLYITFLLFQYISMIYSIMLIFLWRIEVGPAVEGAEPVVPACTVRVLRTYLWWTQACNAGMHAQDPIRHGTALSHFQGRTPRNKTQDSKCRRNRGAAQAWAESA